jgi:hypothetical protein
MIPPLGLGSDARFLKCVTLRTLSEKEEDRIENKDQSKSWWQSNDRSEWVTLVVTKSLAEGRRTPMKVKTDVKAGAGARIDGNG